MKYSMPTHKDGLHIEAAGKEGMNKAWMSRRAAAGRAELLANFLGGAVWGVFRENANCGDPPGTLWGPSRVRVHLAGA